MDKIASAFKIAACIDNARWIHEDNTVNYHINPETIINEIESEIEKAEYVILSHWITYICERQMKFEQIWEKGGFVFSWLVWKYQKCESLEDLKELFATAIKFDVKDGEKKCRFVADKSDCYESALKRADFKDNEPTFASRFPALDGIAIVNTLVTLKKHDGLHGYLQKVIDSDDFRENTGDSVKILLYSMHKLTYENPLPNELENKIKAVDIFNKKQEQKQITINLSDYKTFCENKIFESKRVNCAVRDYISNEFYAEHFKILTGIDFAEQLNQLELPGDVWNNNKTFGDCIEKIGIKHTRGKLNKALRREYKEDFTGCPVQFDITFDFVPNMCKAKPESKCNICIFGFVKNKESFDSERFNELCKNDKTTNCGVLREYCKYEVPCSSESNTCIKRLLEELTKNDYA